MKYGWGRIFLVYTIYQDATFYQMFWLYHGGLLSSIIFFPKKIIWIQLDGIFDRCLNGHYEIQIGFVG